MAFPWLFESNFEQGDTSEWTSQQDTGSLMSFPHYSAMAREDVSKIGHIAPWRGAYSMLVNCGDTNAHTLTSSTVTIADTVVDWSRFYLFIGYDFTATADDDLAVLQLNSAAAVQNYVGLRIIAATGVINIGCGKTAITNVGSRGLVRGRWYCIEVSHNIRTDGAGVVTVYVDGTQEATVTSLTNIAVTKALLGTADTLATTIGHLYFDAYVFDDARIYPMLDRYPENVWVTKSMHVCLGDSTLLDVTLINGAGTDNVLKIYDTDEANVTDESAICAHLYNLTASEPPIDLADVPLRVKRGAYIQLAGTNPRALIHVGLSHGHYSVSNVRQVGYTRKPHRIQRNEE